MSAVLAIACREVRERRFILAAAAAFSALALGFHFAPSSRAQGAGDALALLVFLAFPAGAALAVGSSLVGRDLAEGRLSFYFSRPLSTTAIWAGKLLGGALLVLGAFLCCAIPVAWPLGRIGSFAVLLWTLSLLGLMGVAHVASTMYRSGSRLILLDLGLGAAFVGLLSVLLRGLFDAGAGRTLFEVVLPVGAGLALVVSAAGAAAQLAYGRTDTRRSHRALSVVVWGLAFAVLGGLGLWSSWLLAATPRDVGGAGFPFSAAPRGSAIFFKGSSEESRAGYVPCFLLDGESGAYLRVPPHRVTWPAFSGDGKVAAWVALGGTWGWFVPPYSEGFPPEIGDPRARLAALRGMALSIGRLDGGRPSVQEHPLRLPDAATGALAVDEEGRRVLLASRSAVFLVSTAEGALVSQQSLADVITADFLVDGAIRLYRREGDGSGRGVFVVEDWNPRDGSRADRARVEADAFPVLVARRGDLVVVSTGPRGRVLVDAASGSIVRLDSPDATASRVAFVLASGRVALAYPGEVRVVTPQGATVVSIPLDRGVHVHALQEPAPGELSIGLWGHDRVRTLYVDAATGAARREETGLLPAGRLLTAVQPEPGSLASRLLTDLRGSFIAVEPDGRRREIVAGTPESAGP